MKEKKAQLLGSEYLLWIYRFFLISLVALGTVIIVAKYNSIELDKKPLIASQLLNAVLECKEENKLNCIFYNQIYDIYVSYDKKEIGKKDLIILCEAKESGVEIPNIDLFCKNYKIIVANKIKNLKIAIASEK
ncbi:MAG: hypothetical protein QW244_01665 [Candidatus Pacearchaeota archaeon]